MEKYKPEQIDLPTQEVEKLKIVQESVSSLKNIIAILENSGLEAFKKIFKN